MFGGSRRKDRPSRSSGAHAAKPDKTSEAAQTSKVLQSSEVTQSATAVTPAASSSVRSASVARGIPQTLQFANGRFRQVPFEEALDISDVVRRQKSLKLQLVVLRFFTLLLLLAAICVGGFPIAMQYQSQVKLAETAEQSEMHVQGWPYPQAELAFQAAQAYNRKLAQSGQPVMGEAVDPFATIAGHSSASNEENSAASKDTEYQSLLDTGGGVMGSIVVPKVSIDLPIYHGTSESALASGSGHLYGSSLPVGGADTHAVLTGHRGLVEALMFTRLDEMQVGDFFYIKVMGETLGYRVDRITVIEPDDTSQLKIVPGEDRVTLMTCTPYGVNTHRLLVSGVRQAIPDPIPQIKDAPKDYRVWVIAAVAIPLILGLLLLWARHRPWRRMRHGGWWPRRL